MCVPLTGPSGLGQQRDGEPSHHHRRRHDPGHEPHPAGMPRFRPGATGWAWGGPVSGVSPASDDGDVFDWSAAVSAAFPSHGRRLPCRVARPRQSPGWRQDAQKPRGGTCYRNHPGLLLCRGDWRQSRGSNTSSPCGRLRPDHRVSSEPSNRGGRTRSVHCSACATACSIDNPSRRPSAIRSCNTVAGMSCSIDAAT